MLSCKGRAQNKCANDLCLYANGSLRKYCRRRSRCRGRSIQTCKNKCKVASGNSRTFCRKRFNKLK